MIGVAKLVKAAGHTLKSACCMHRRQALAAVINTLLLK
jgi:hypothetical protein